MTGDKKTGDKNTSGRGQRELRVRVKTAKGRKLSSTLWLERQLNDPYVAQAKRDGLRSRAAYKLIELDERFHFLRGAKRVIDLGIAPGGWTQVVRKHCPQAKVVGIDLLPTDPIDGAVVGARSGNGRGARHRVAVASAAETLRSLRPLSRMTPIFPIR